MDLRFSRYGKASTEPSPVNRMMSAFAGTFRDGIDCNLGVGYVNEETIPVDGLAAAMQAVVADPREVPAGFQLRHRRRLGESDRVPAAVSRPPAHRTARRGHDRTQAADRRPVRRHEPARRAGGRPRTRGGGHLRPDLLHLLGCARAQGLRSPRVPEDDDGIDLDALDRQTRGFARTRGADRFLLHRDGEQSVLHDALERAPPAPCSSWRRAADPRRRAARFRSFTTSPTSCCCTTPTASRSSPCCRTTTMGIAYEIGTLSKVLAPALRVGYILGPDGPLMDVLAQWATDAGLGGPLFVQEMASYLLERRIDDQLEAVNCGLPRQGGRACARGSAGARTPARGLPRRKRGLLLLPDVPRYRDSSRVGLLSLPDPKYRGRGGGTAAGHLHPGRLLRPPQGRARRRWARRQLRLSYGFEDSGRIVQALALMRQAAEYATAPS